MSKLVKFKKWLTISEAAQYLSTMIGEEVKESDIYRLTLDGHLKISVNFVNFAHARIGRIVTFEEAIWEEEDIFEKWAAEGNLRAQKFLEEINSKTEPNKIGPMLVSLHIGKNQFVNFDKGIQRIEGVWDLLMFGAERLDIEHKYQLMTGGPEVTLCNIDGTFVIDRERRIVCELQENFDNNPYHRGSTAYLDEIKRRHFNSYDIDEEQKKTELEAYEIDRKQFLADRFENPNCQWYPAGGIPRDSVLVVRTEALRDLEKELTQESNFTPPPNAVEKPISGKAKNAYLRTINALTSALIGGRTGQPSTDALAALAALDQAGITPPVGERALADYLKEADKLSD